MRLITIGYCESCDSDDIARSRTSSPSANKSAVSCRKTKWLTPPQRTLGLLLILVLLFIHIEPTHTECSVFSVHEDSYPALKWQSGDYDKPPGVLTTTTTTEDCVEACCRTEDCDVAWVISSGCYIISCYSAESCEPAPVEGGHVVSTLVFVRRSTTTIKGASTQHTGREDPYQSPYSTQGLHTGAPAKEANIKELLNLLNLQAESQQGQKGVSTLGGGGGRDTHSTLGGEGRDTHSTLGGEGRDTHSTLGGGGGRDTHSTLGGGGPDTYSTRGHSSDRIDDLSSLTPIIEELIDEGYTDKTHSEQTSPTPVVETGVLVCEVGFNDCPSNETCTPVYDRRRDGFCTCVAGYHRDKESGACQPNPTTTAAVRTSRAGDREEGTALGDNPSTTEDGAKRTPSPTVTPTLSLGVGSREMDDDDETMTLPPLTQLMEVRGEVVTTPSVVATVTLLTVTVGDNKFVQLPNNSVDIETAVEPPAPGDGAPYALSWSVLAAPPDSAAVVEGDGGGGIHISELTAGVYELRVVARGDGGAFGDAYINITVATARRVNAPPVAVVTTDDVTLPTDGSPATNILDGTGSHDDDGIVAYRWEMIKGPLVFQDLVGDQSVLELNGLVEGYYTFTLTVTDTDTLTAATSANFTVHRATDNPPISDPGGPHHIQLPINSIVLNGNKSSDDRGIVSYEWTLSPETEPAAVDMQGTKTARLSLWNLVPGNYEFYLKVTDTAGQTDRKPVRIVVEAEDDQPPTADAGSDKELSYPDSTLTTLNGVDSHDDQGVVWYRWQQTGGPSDAVLDDPEGSAVTVSKLIVGEYTFTLTVGDRKDQQDTDVVAVNVKQNINEPPNANAGGDKTYRLPSRTLYLDGSESSDDVSIVKYLWTRDPRSLAAGNVVTRTDEDSVLMVTDLIPGVYIFHLTVTDNKGLEGTDTATVTVEKDPYELDLVELHLVADIGSFTEEQRTSVLRHLAVLLKVPDDAVVLDDITSSRSNGDLVLTFYVRDVATATVVRGTDVVRRLKKQSTVRSLDYTVTIVDTLVCQNNCSNHGSCNDFTKRCKCEAFWVENTFKLYFGLQESNCDWSILYVILTCVFLLMAFVALIWMGVYLLRRFCYVRRKLKPRKRARYKLLDNGETRERIGMLPKAGKYSALMSDTDTNTDEETLFEQRTNNGAHKKNGFVLRKKPQPLSRPA